MNLFKKKILFFYFIYLILGIYVYSLLQINEFPQKYVFTEWYDYDVDTHILTAKPIYYVIRNRNEMYFKFKIDDYYDSAGTPAKVLVQWEQIETPNVDSNER